MKSRPVGLLSSECGVLLKFNPVGLSSVGVVMEAWVSVNKEQRLIAMGKRMLTRPGSSSSLILINIYF